MIFHKGFAIELSEDDLQNLIKGNTIGADFDEESLVTIYVKKDSNESSQELHPSQNASTHTREPQ